MAPAVEWEQYEGMNPPSPGTLVICNCLHNLR